MTQDKRPKQPPRPAPSGRRMPFRLVISWRKFLLFGEVQSLLPCQFGEPAAFLSWIEKSRFACRHARPEALKARAVMSLRVCAGPIQSNASMVMRMARRAAHSRLDQCSVVGCLANRLRRQSCTRPRSFRRRPVWVIHTDQGESGCRQPDCRR